MADFKTIHTNYGLEALASAEATSSVINLPEMAVGDGNGNPVTPNENQTQLVRERYRAPVNRVYQSSTDPTLFYAELVIPASVGGFVLREVGVFDDAGSLFVVGNLPETYKPEADEENTTFSDTVVRIGFKVSNADTVQIIADPNVVVVTQAWIQNNVNAATVIPGGTTGQVLTKQSNSDGDYVWAAPDVANITVDVLEERQTLAASQTVVTWTTVTTRGLAVYIDGVRINKGSGADEWDDNPASPETQIVLGTSYPAGTSILGVQNNPAGAVPYPLIRDNNLSDVPNKAAARSELDVYSKAEAEAIVPPGAVIYFARNTAPSGWLKCNGAAISRTAYAKLFAAIGTVFGAGDGFTTFNLPDLRGEFVRGWDDGRGVDGGRAFGSFQAGMIQSHSHTGGSASAGAHNHSGSAVAGGSHNHSASTGGGGSHAHSGTTSGGGSHQHNLPAGSVAPGGNSGYGIMASGDDMTYLVAGWSVSQWAGDHSHSFTTSTIGDHTHAVSVGTGGEHTHALSINSAGAHTHAITIDATGGAETRPRNIALLPCIRF
ncbi:tail protein [Pseudomonas phage ZRG1]|nr:tail protein [Pseudomonas phage ZRG1]